MRATAREKQLNITWEEIVRLGTLARIAHQFISHLDQQRREDILTSEQATAAFYALVQSHDSLQEAFRLARSLLNKH